MGLVVVSATAIAQSRRMDSIVGVLAEQQGVIARAQVVVCGGNDDLIRRNIRRREWVRVHTGVYVDHTGPLAWIQRVWAAVLFYGGAVVCDESALRLQHCAGGTGRGSGEDVIHVAIDRSRRAADLPRVRLHVIDLRPEEILFQLKPPRMRLEYALLRVAAGSTSDTAAIAVLADACQQRRTTPQRLLASLSRRPRLPRRRFLVEVLDDVAEGAYSVLEHRYLTRVERPHGLPTAKRQRRVTVGRTAAYRDVEYLGLSTVVELDGRLGHEETNDRWNDMDRDLDAAGAGRTTMRIGWRQVEDPCRSAAAVGAMLRVQGWVGDVRRCSPDCALGPIGERFQAPGA